MKDFIQERIAIANGVALDSEMVKKAERRRINKEYIIINEYGEAYNELKYHADNHGFKYINDWIGMELNKYKYEINRR